MQPQKRWASQSILIQMAISCGAPQLCNCTLICISCGERFVWATFFFLVFFYTPRSQFTPSQKHVYCFFVYTDTLSPSSVHACMDTHVCMLIQTIALPCTFPDRTNVEDACLFLKPFRGSVFELTSSKALRLVTLA